jgi:riboflavin kinase/FMN adenylyltransferase
VTAAPGDVVTIGVFDGVHRGHRMIIGRAVAAAREQGARATVVTFDPHPAAVVRPDAVPLLLTTIERRVTLLRATGVDDVVVLSFTAALSRLSPEDFARQVLTDRLHATHVVVGADWRFGHQAAGDVDLLRRIGFSVDGVHLLATAGHDPVSSSYVRGLVAAGDVTAAAAALQRPHLVEGPVVRGDARGRDLGYPTANVAVAAGIAVPADGVYAGWLTRATGERLAAAVSVGSNPTFDGVAGRRVEAFALDAAAGLDLYGEHVVVEFAERLRGMVRFDSVEALVEQMDRDVEATRAVVAR